MVSNVAVIGGWEIVLMLITWTAVLAAILLLVYLVVRLATRPRSLRAEDQRT